MMHVIFNHFFMAKYFWKYCTHDLNNYLTVCFCKSIFYKSHVCVYYIWDLFWIKITVKMSIIMMIIIIIIINVTETKWLKAEVCMKNKGYLQRRVPVEVMTVILTTGLQMWREWWPDRKWKSSIQHSQWLTVPPGGPWWAVHRDKRTCFTRRHPRHL